MTPTNDIDVPSIIAAQKIGRFQLAVLIICAVMLMVDGFDTQMIGYVGPALTDAFHVDKSALGPLLSAGLAGLMLGALGLGIAADRIGRKAVILISLAIFGVFTLAGAWAASVQALSMLRFLAGLGLGGIIPNGIALVSEYAPRRHQATLVTLLNAGFSIGAALAGFGAAMLLPRYGWESLFITGGLLPLLLIPVGMFLLPESVRLLALRGGDRTKIVSIMQKVSPATVFASDARFLVVEENSAGSTVKHLFTNGRAAMTIFVWLTFFMNLIVLYFLAGWMPTAMVSRGLTSSNAVMATALIYLGGVIGSLLLGWFMDRLGSHVVLALCYATGGVFLAVIALAGTNVPMIMIAAGVTGFCIVGGQNGLNAYAGSLYPTFIRGTGVGWALGIGRIGGVFGPLLVGGLFALEWQISSIFYVAILPPVIGVVTVLCLGHLAARKPIADGTPISVFRS
jgi:AAHS family 4-hydroxybenzoate transporter-like MFS transporter